ncbi:hypothetical protein GGH99_007042, partial [Coemansia sp. RSA 1285]
TSSHKHHLDNGDVLSYVAGSVASTNTLDFDLVNINVDLLLSTVLQLQLGSPGAPSSYRPLMYMPWVSRADSFSGHFRNSDRPPPSHSSYGQARSRSRGRTGTGDEDRAGHRGYGSHPTSGYARGSFSHRQPPYARSTGYNSGSSRSHGRGGSGQGYAPRGADRGPYR